LKREYYGFIKLLRDANAHDSDVESDLKKLSEFLRFRAARSKDVEYYVVTMVRKSDSEGLIIVKGEDKGRVDYEIELLMGFIASSCTALEGTIISGGRVTGHLPIPHTGNF